MQTTIRVDSRVRDRLETLKQDGESLGDVVQRLVESYNPFAGLSRVSAMPEVSAAVHIGQADEHRLRDIVRILHAATSP